MGYYKIWFWCKNKSWSKIKIIKWNYKVNYEDVIPRFKKLD